MALLWEQPEKALTAEQWKSISADGAPPGVYTPNMSRANAEKWRAKLTGHKSGHPQVEIRVTRGGQQLLVIVSLKGIIKYQGRTNKCNVQMSTNGRMVLSFDDMQALNDGIAEAKAVLEQYP